MIRGFYYGVYQDYIESHIWDISGWFEQQLTDLGKISQGTFLLNVIFDMLSSHQHFNRIYTTLYVNHLVLVKARCCLLLTFLSVDTFLYLLIVVLKLAAV